MEAEGDFICFALNETMYHLLEVNFHFPSSHQIDGVLSNGEVRLVQLAPEISRINALRV